MSTLSASDARANLYRLIDEVAQSHRPVRITGRRANAVLISEDDWNAMQETLHLLATPGLRESVFEEMREPLDASSAEPGW